MKMENCPRFSQCSAPLCPLDKDLMKRKMLRGERLCHYIREHSKGNLRGSVPIELFQVVAEAYPVIFNWDSGTRTRLTTISQTPSKRGNW